jgi:protoheme IX farnesyltransferase
LSLGAVSTPMLFWVNPATGALGLVALVTYAAIYTPLKRHSWLALLVGAVPGAMPPLMGWTTVTGSITVPGLLLFGVLFLWQVPHFAAITLFRTNDYARAGLMVIAVQRGESAAKRTIALYTVLLVASSLLLYPFHLAGERYLAIAAVTGGAFLTLAFRGLAAKIVTTKWAKLVFASSILYLVVLLGSLLLDRPGV